MAAPVISTQTRCEALAEMSAGSPLDILVIGGGVTGAGIALDAATRGLRVGILEAQDWAAGTSSRSSKLVHGGLRYLYQLDFKLVAEALQERGLLLTRNAPHLVKAQPFLWPLKVPVIERSYSAIGVGLYDALGQLAHPGSVPIQKHYSKAGARALFPGIKNNALSGAIRFYDARVDDARLVITLVRTAVKYGAFAASRTAVTRITTAETGRVTGVAYRDLETGTTGHIAAHTVINSTGVWTEETQDLAPTTGGLQVLTSKGIHLVIPKDRIAGETGMFLRTEKSVLFIIPWKRYWIIGTTDTKYEGNLRNPAVTQEDIDYLLAHANSVLEDPLTREDIIGTYAGLRPLLQPGTKDGDKTKYTKVSREHTVTEAAPGLVVIAGGKLTTYRVMAEDAVDFALGEEEAQAHPSRTRATPLSGADGYQALWEGRERLSEEFGLSLDHIEDLLDRYGSDIFAVLALAEDYPQLALLAEVAGAPEYLRAEVAYAVLGEGALHLEDIFLHRVRLSFEHRDRGLAVAPEVADLCQELLDWSASQTEQELFCYQSRCAAEEKAATASSETQAELWRGEAVEISPTVAEFSGSAIR